MNEIKKILVEDFALSKRVLYEASIKWVFLICMFREISRIDLELKVKCRVKYDFDSCRKIDVKWCC